MFYKSDKTLTDLLPPSVGVPYNYNGSGFTWGSFDIGGSIDKIIPINSYMQSGAFSVFSGYDGFVIYTPVAELRGFGAGNTFRIDNLVGYVNESLPQTVVHTITTTGVLSLPYNGITCTGAVSLNGITGLSCVAQLPQYGVVLTRNNFTASVQRTNDGIITLPNNRRASGELMGLYLNYIKWQSQSGDGWDGVYTYYAQVSGSHLVSVTLLQSDLVSGENFITIEKNGTSSASGERVDVVDGSSLTIVAIVELAAGDYIKTKLVAGASFGGGKISIVRL